jgi:Fe2+ or Zn2+ uptake regulation protein
MLLDAITGTSWSDEVLAALSAEGLRRGAARRTVIEFLDRQAACLSALEIFEKLRAEGGSVGVATDYRVPRAPRGTRRGRPDRRGRRRHPL